MKSAITTKIKGTLLTLGLGMLSFAGNAQEHITLSLQNISSTSNTIEFDLFVINDGSTSLKLSACAFGINYNGAILNGAVPSETAYTAVQGTKTRELSSLTPFVYKNTIRENVNQLRITNTPTKRENSPELLKNVPYKIGRYKFTNTTPWSPNSNPMLSLNEYNVPGISTSCATAYIDNQTNPKGFSTAKKNLKVQVVNSPMLNPSETKDNVVAQPIAASSNQGTNNGVDQTSSAKVSIYPNPTQDILHVDLTSASVSNTVVKVLDMRGRVVKQIQAKSEKGLNTMTVSLREIANGMYTVQVLQDNVLSFTEKVTKKD